MITCYTHSHTLYSIYCTQYTAIHCSMLCYREYKILFFFFFPQLEIGAFVHLLKKSSRLKMSLFWGKKKHVPSAKERLIREMQMVYPSVRRCNPDDSLFELSVRPSTVPFTIRILLDKSFPDIKPGQ